MDNTYNLERFITAQETSYPIAFDEIKNSKKRTHWMWYIFPQVQGLGFSETTKKYSIQNISEAAAFLQHPLLGKRLLNISAAALQLQSNNATAIFGSPDDMKLQSCMTLFASLPDTNPVFQSVLNKFFGGKMDSRTLAILKENS